MASTAAPSRPDEDTMPALGKGEHGHPSDLQFIGIALLLAALTAIEVGLYYVEQAEAINQRANVTLLLLLAAVKFAVVAGWFMHLKFDHPQFKRYFIGGGILAGFCYIAVLAAFGVLPPWSWIVYGASALVMVVMAAVRNKIFDRNEAGHDGHEHDDHADHDHADHDHAAHAH